MAPAEPTLSTYSSALVTHMSTQRYFFALVLLIVACGVARSWWATALDGFTIDEAYQDCRGRLVSAFSMIFASTGTSAARQTHVHRWRGDAAVRPAHLAPPPHLEGKAQERDYTETAVYLNSNAQIIQQRARVAMIAFHSVLTVDFAGMLLRRLFNLAIALVTLGILLLDPTVGAHMPVVMTGICRSPSSA